MPTPSTSTVPNALACRIDDTVIVLEAFADRVEVLAPSYRSPMPTSKPNPAEALALRMVERADRMDAAANAGAPDLAADAEAARADAAEAYALGDRLSKPSPNLHHVTRRTVYHFEPVKQATPPPSESRPAFSPGKIALLRQTARLLPEPPPERAESGGYRYLYVFTLDGDEYIGVGPHGAERWFVPTS